MINLAFHGKRFANAGVAASACLVILCVPARPAEIDRRGATITLAGAIVGGDEFKFRDMLKAAGGGAVEIVNLNSDGGDIAPAGEIGRLIRTRRLATLVDGMRAKCASACTVIFAGGVRRYYINAETLSEGPMSNSNFIGLGFHDGNSQLALAKNKYSGRASAQMIGFFYEFGIPRAAALVTKAPPEQLYRISGQTALAIGIATALRRP